MRVLLEDYVGEFASALWVTAQLTGVSFVLAVAIGLVLATFRISPITPLRLFAGVYVEIFRNVPLVALVLLVVYGLPEIDINIDWIPSVIVAMTLVGSAFACETIRTGINTVDVGQVEAARSVGMTFAPIVRLIVAPQAVRSMISPIVTLFIGVLLSSSLAAVVGVGELTFTVSSINNREALGLTTFAVAAVIYASVSLGAAWLGNRAERRWQVYR